MELFMKMRALKFLSLSFLLIDSLGAMELFFTGNAAKTLFVCDDKAAFACWFAHGSYCRLRIRNNLASGYEILLNNKLNIYGDLAKKIYKITRDCSDGDEPPYQTYYGHEGIACSIINKTYNCELEVDRLNIIRKRKGT